MTKIAIKKNVKPKTVKQKQKQTQKTNVTVNIGTNIIKKKRGRPPKKAQAVKPVQQPINPVIQSFNQPMFKQSTPQPTSLTSSILATQDKPKVVSEEVKEQSTLRKALEEQNTNIEEPKVNELERVRSERVKKFQKPKDDTTENTIKEMKKEEPIRHALLGQLLSDLQDDTEEINALSFKQTQRTIPFSPETASIGTQTSKFPQRFRIGFPPFLQTEESELPSIEPLLSRSQQRNNLLERQDVEPSQEVSTEPTQTEPTNETPLTQPEERGPAELVTQTETTESQPLSHETVEMGFGGLTEEPIQTSVGQFLPPEPVSQEQLLRKQQQLPPLSILSPIPYRTERLVKDDEGPAEPPPPIAQAESVQQASFDEPTITQEAKPLKPSDYVKQKWRELKSQGHFEGLSITFTTSNGKSQDRPSADLEAEIQTIEPSYKRPSKRKPGKSIQSTNVIEATEI